MVSKGSEFSAGIDAMTGEGLLKTVARLESSAKHRLTDDGTVRLSWRIWGEGPPLVLLHGGFGSWLHWAPNIGDLAETFSVHAVDLPGLGDSGPPPDGYTAPILAEAMGRGIDLVLGDEVPVLIGAFSLGSVIAAPLIHRMGARARGGVLIGASGLGPMWKNAIASQRQRRSTMSEAELREIVRENLRASMISDGALIDDDVVSVQMRLLNQNRRLIGLPLSQSGIVLDHLPKISDRTILLWGDDDPYLQPDVPSAIAELRSRCPGLDVRIIGNAGHWANFEQVERVNAVIREVAAKSGTTADR